MPGNRNEAIAAAAALVAALAAEPVAGAPAAAAAPAAPAAPAGVAPAAAVPKSSSCCRDCWEIFLSTSKTLGIVGGVTVFLIAIVPHQLYYLLLVTFPLWLWSVLRGSLLSSLLTLLICLFVFKRDAIVDSWHSCLRRLRGERLTEVDDTYINEAEDLAADSAVLRFLARKWKVNEDDVNAYLRKEGTTFYEADRKLHVGLCGCECPHYADEQDA